MKGTGLLLFAGLAFAGAVFAQAPAAPGTPPPSQKERDLKFEKGEAPPDKNAGSKLAIPRSYAVVIGIAGYQNLPASAQLQFSERDAELIYTGLISQEGGNFKAENVHKLIGAKATLANVRRELEQWLPSVAKEDDRVLVYFAGHGFVYNKTGKAYLAPYDIKLQDVASTGYPMDDLGRVIGSQVKAKWKILITDSCHSGAISPQEENDKVNQSLQDLTRSLFSLTASRARERSFESPQWGGGQGVFSYYVVQGLSGSADEDHDGRVTADELAEYVHRNVREATNGQQNPTSDKGNFDPQMVLAYFPNGSTAGERPAPKDGTFVFETNMDGTEIFLDGKSVGTADKAKVLRLPGLPPGRHTIKAVRMGYEPDGPREEIIYPGTESTVSIKIMIPRRRNKAAVEQLDKGIELYQKGSKENYQKAAEYFTEALHLDPKYSQAALYQARAYRDLFDYEKAKQAFLLAIEIDPDYLEAHSNYGGMLLDIGDVDESIRQLNYVLQRTPNDGLAECLIAQAYARKGDKMYPMAIEAARKSVQLNPKNAEAHLWLAESLRLSNQWQAAVPEYRQYLQLSDFDSKWGGKLNYYVLGYTLGMGRKRHAGTRDVWRELRGRAYFGVCDSQRLLKQYGDAIPNCERALAYDTSDALAHYVLALCLMHQANETQDPQQLAAANIHFRSVVELDPDLAESENARKNILLIDGYFRKQ